MSPCLASVHYDASYYPPYYTYGRTRSFLNTYSNFEILDRVDTVVQSSDEYFLFLL